MIPRASGPVLTPAECGVVAPTDSRWPLNDQVGQYAVQDLYPAIQGEGRQTGTPMTIVRLAGCPVGCAFCFGIKAGKRIPRVHLARPRSGTGRMQLHHVKRGDVLLTLDERHQLVETTVTRVHSRRVEEWYEIKIDKYGYYVTPEHPFRTRRGWVEARSLQVGETIFHATPLELGSYYKRGASNPNWNPAAKLHAPHLLMLKRRNSRRVRACAWCGIQRWLEVHHLDGDRKNDQLSNLVSICHRCHSRHHRRGENFWNGQRVDGKRSAAEVKHNGAVVESSRLVSRGIAWAEKHGGGYVGTLPVYNLTCAPHNSFLLDYLWVHNCDTPETWARPALSAWIDARVVAQRVQATGLAWALVTGGEPTWHHLESLTAALRAIHCRTALETSGVYPITGSWDWITVSPKPRGMLPLNPEVLRYAHEVKWIVGKADDVDALETFLRTHALARGVAISVQPMSTSARATELCLSAVMAHPTWFLSLQTHKLIGRA